jgi:hypothetical protein
MFKDKIAIIAFLSAITFLGSAFTFYNLTKRLVQTEPKPEPVECQRIYAKAKACIEMESHESNRFKYNP